MRNLFGLLTIFICIAGLGNLSAEEKKHDATTNKQPVIESFDISPDPVGKGDVFTMTIIVDHENSAEVDFPLKEKPEDLQLWRGPYVRSFIYTDKDGNSSRKVRITTTFKALKSGRMIIPGLSVIVDSKRLETNPYLLRVGLYKNRKLYMPIEVEWQAGFEEIYTGEAVPLFLTVLNQEKVILFDSTKVAVPRAGFFEEAGGIGEISSISEGDIILYDIPAATYIYTSAASGEVKIPSAGVDYEGITGWTNNLFLSIKHPPSELQSGAVGRFMFESSIDKSTAETGSDIILSCTVEGDGNLNYLKMPEPSIEGGILVSSDEKNMYAPSLYGFSGSKTIDWIFNAENPGTIEIIVPGFDYLDKTRGEIVSFSEKTFKVVVSSAANSEPTTASKETFPFQKIASSEMESSGWENNYKYYFRYIWMLPALVFFLIVKIMKGKRPVLAGVLTIIILVSIISVGRFVLNLGENVSEDRAGSATLYNTAVDNYNNGELTASLHNLRTAVYLDPVNTKYRNALDWIESHNGYVNSISPSIILHPDIFYFIIIAAFNLFFISASVKIYKPGGVVSVLIILFGFICIFSAFMIIYTDNSRKNLTGVVCSDSSSLKKIPRETAEDWLPMKQGTAVRLLDKSEQFLLVETGLGVKGWIGNKCIIPDRKDLDLGD